MALPVGAVEHPVCLATGLQVVPDCRRVVAGVATRVIAGLLLLFQWG